MEVVRGNGKEAVCEVLEQHTNDDVDNTSHSCIMPDIMVYFSKELAPDICTLRQQGRTGAETISPITIVTNCIKDIIEISRSL